MVSKAKRQKKASAEEGAKEQEQQQQFQAKFQELKGVLSPKGEGGRPKNLLVSLMGLK